MESPRAISCAYWDHENRGVRAGHVARAVQPAGSGDCPVARSWIGRASAVAQTLLPVRIRADWQSAIQQTRLSALQPPERIPP